MFTTDWDLSEKREAQVNWVVFSLNIAEEGVKGCEVWKAQGKEFQGEMKNETGKVFWGHIWSRT